MSANESVKSRGMRGGDLYLLWLYEGRMATRVLAFISMVLAAGCLQAENGPCRDSDECAQRLCYIAPACSKVSYCFGACRASCTSTSDLTFPAGQRCQCMVSGVQDGGCACIAFDAGI